MDTLIVTRLLVLKNKVQLTHFGSENAKLRYSYTGFLIKCFILDIWQGSQYALILEYTRLWIYMESSKYVRVAQGFEWHTVDVWQYSEYALDSKYARVLTMLGLHKILNKIL